MISQDDRSTNMPSHSVYSHCSEGISPKVFTDIYQDKINLCIWHRPQLSNELTSAVKNIVTGVDKIEVAEPVATGNVDNILNQKINGMLDVNTLSHDITQLVEMFCCLFGLNRVGLRLNSLDKAMCPKFHCDKIQCRLVTTYYGNGTQWLPNHLVDRDQLGFKSHGLIDGKSGVYRSEFDIQQLQLGDVALLKGENWQDNSGSGIVHRSPDVRKGEKRLMLTLDFMLG